MMQNKLGQYTPEWIKARLRPIKDAVRITFYRGEGRWCPVCTNHSRKFAPFGLYRRVDAQCVFCGALERHRFAWLYFGKVTTLFDGKPKKMLHVAPERCFEPRLRENLGQHYITADLRKPHVMVKMDITNIQYPDEYFDVIYCSHVLEHVQDDKKAMREFFRVLKPDGWAILLVPVTVAKTLEDPSVVTPAARLRAFGQEDHVRRYGADYPDRLREAGFDVRVSQVSDLFDTTDAVRMGLTSASGEIYYCTKGRPGQTGSTQERP